MMKTGKGFSLLIVLGITIFLGAPTTYAAVSDNTSDSSVQFTADVDGTTPPVNPTNPGEDVTPTDPVTPTTGALRIDFASRISFGKQKIFGKDMAYHPPFSEVKRTSDGTTLYVPQFVQVTDNTGLNAGWNLEVSGTPFTTTSGAELTGAALTLSGTTLRSKLDSKYTPSTIVPSLTVGSSPQLLVAAAAGEGMSVWTAAFGDSAGSAGAQNTKITLHVPAETVKLADETYTSTLTWTLSSAP
ncbi:WxL domain-containing protein [Listeria kieliensis]|uniref:WxL domain-containing protein n=1 Tax=Listeria kieliensis TaxID=1621700 RepID=UPI000E219194|nr:WxL domain-containing protein [Listeria kieliensis]